MPSNSFVCLALFKSDHFSAKSHSNDFSTKLIVLPGESVDRQMETKIYSIVALVFIGFVTGFASRRNSVIFSSIYAPQQQRQQQ